VAWRKGVIESKGRTSELRRPYRRRVKLEVEPKHLGQPILVNREEIPRSEAELSDGASVS